jgi:HPt (histidine-containing phosphotransfer) domain-containing protein
MKDVSRKINKAAVTAGPVRMDALLIGAACIAFIAIVFVPGLRLANALSKNSSALKFVSEQRRYPLAFQSVLESVQDRLNSRGFVQTPLDQLRHDEAALSAAIEQMSASQGTGWFDTATSTTALAQPALQKSILALRSDWAGYRKLLEPLIDFKGLPYKDNESSGATLTETGKRLEAEVNAALRAAHKTIPQIDAEFGNIGEQLEVSNDEAVAKLSLVMFAGLLFAAVFLTVVIALRIAREGQEDAVREAHEQSESIFRTVKEGLFLLDRDLVIGAAHSAAMKELFKREDIAGLRFEDLLKGIVPEKTLKTAMKFVNVLWSERTKENLVRSINPLGEVEVSFNTESGPSTQYLEFDFHRVRTSSEISHVLVSVSDVSARVALAAELRGAQDKSQAQIDTLLGLLQVDPDQLASFLGDSDASIQMINAILREPARDEGVFRKKLDSIFRQVHSVKGEAAAIGLTSIENRAHTFEEDLRALREKSTLSGNDFLPLIVKLDDLFTHMQSIREMVSRLSRLQLVSRAQEPARAATSGKPSVIPINDSDIGAVLRQLAERIAQENGKSVRLQLTGLELLPADYRRTVKDITVQAVRNAVVHGIEPSSARAACGKADCGVIRIDVVDLGNDGYKLSVEDDGQGLATDKIIASAVQRGFITAEEAPTLGTKQVVRLLFRSGFSTVEHATKDAGRGVGMNLIADLVQQAGGKLGISTVPGKFTRFTVSLPTLQSREPSHAVGL